MPFFRSENRKTNKRDRYDYDRKFTQGSEIARSELIRDTKPVLGSKFLKTKKALYEYLKKKGYKYNIKTERWIK